MEEFKVETSSQFEIVDLTPQIEKILQEEELKEGLIFIFVPHTTCALILTENEENLKKDFLKLFKKLTENIEFSHNLIDDNASAHLFSSLFGQEKLLMVENQKLVLGTWQRLCLLELDGPRQRNVYLKFIKTSQ